MKTEIIEFSRQSIRKINEIDDLVDSYSEQIGALVDGGVDCLLIETVFDTLTLLQINLLFNLNLYSYGTSSRSH